MKHFTLVALLLTGCAGVESSNSRQVTMSVFGQAGIPKAQVQADAECAKHGRIAILHEKLPPSRLIYECMDR